MGFFSVDLAPMCKPKLPGVFRLNKLDQFESRQAVFFALRDAIDTICIGDTKCPGARGFLMNLENSTVRLFLA